MLPPSPHSKSAANCELRNLGSGGKNLNRFNARVAYHKRWKIEWRCSDDSTKQNPEPDPQTHTQTQTNCATIFNMQNVIIRIIMSTVELHSPCHAQFETSRLSHRNCDVDDSVLTPPPEWRRCEMMPEYSTIPFFGILHICTDGCALSCTIPYFPSLFPVATDNYLHLWCLSSASLSAMRAAKLCIVRTTARPSA